MPKATKKRQATSRGRGRPTKYRQEMCQQIIEIMGEGASITEAAHRMGIRRETIHDWAKTNEEFSHALKDGLAAAQQWWEAEARKAIFGGTEKFSAAAWIFMMKNRFKEDYRDVQRVENTGADGGPIEHEHRVAVQDIRQKYLPDDGEHE